MPSHRFAFWAPRDVPLDHGLCQNGTTWAATDAAAAGLCLDTKPWRGRGEKSPRLDLVSFWEKSWNMIGWDGILYILYDRENLTQPLPGIIYRPTYTYYHSHYHCHDQYHMMLSHYHYQYYYQYIKIMSYHIIFTLCRIISHHIYIIYTHVIMFFLAISPYLCTTCPTGLPQAGACPSRPLGPCHGVTEVPQVPRRWELVSANRRMFNGLVCCKNVQKPFHV